MRNKIFGYIRVSSKDQCIDRQLDSIKSIIDDERNIFIDKISGKNFDRPEYVTLKRIIREGDTLIIKELDRFGRNSEQIKKEWQWFCERNIGIKVLDMPILNTAEKKEDIQKLISNIVLEVLSYTAEKERKDIKKTQREGIEQAKNKGIRFGRPPVKKPDEFAKYFKLLDDYKITATQMMTDLNLKPNSFYKLLKSHLGSSQYKIWKKNRRHYKK
ncbi:MAG TPA: recombinase family protein [Victivallales bacterium]|nr:recombinase family protein [Victivallales bacterium]